MPGSPSQSHADLIAEAGTAYRFDLLSVADTAPGQLPVVEFQVVDPTNSDAPYDVLNDPAFTQPGGASRLAVTLSWSTEDFTNTGNGEDDASAVSIDALAGAVNLGGNVFQVISATPIPDGSQAPGVAAEGSGSATLEGHPAEVIAGELERIPVFTPLLDFSISEPDGQPVARRDVADFDGCASCHDTLVIHGDNRKDNLQMCATCHNPRNTDLSVREIALDPPTDGKDEESLDFKTMVHGIHAPELREAPLEIVGFRGSRLTVTPLKKCSTPDDSLTAPAAILVTAMRYRWQRVCWAPRWIPALISRIRRTILWCRPRQRYVLPATTAALQPPIWKVMVATSRPRSSGWITALLSNNVRAVMGKANSPMLLCSTMCRSPDCADDSPAP